jgi:hypothetical protein
LGWKDVRKAKKDKPDIAEELLMENGDEPEKAIKRKNPKFQFDTLQPWDYVLSDDDEDGDFDDNTAYEGL